MHAFWAANNNNNNLYHAIVTILQPWAASNTCSVSISTPGFDCHGYPDCEREQCHFLATLTQVEC